MAADFDPEDKNSWYFGPLSREDTNGALQAAREAGVFLVRDSKSIAGDFVLCVKEENKVSHYIINKIQTGGMIRFRIGDQEFPDLPSLLNFYKTHYLDTTSLLRPAPREKYMAKYDFPGRDPEDLPFKKGEVLTILQKDEDQWWTARNGQGSTGLVPVPYIEKYDPDRVLQDSRPVPPMPQPQPDSDPMINGKPKGVKLPALARAIKQRVPCAYDTKALKLEIGDLVKVTATHITGQWEGECQGQTGSFPFTHIQFIDPEQEGGEPDEL